MADDLYPVGDEAEQAETAPNEADETDTGKDEGTTALLPESILAGKKFNVGDEVVLKIVHIGDGEVEVAYAPSKEKTGEGEDGSGGKPEMGAAEGDMMAMMEGQ